VVVGPVDTPGLAGRFVKVLRRDVNGEKFISVDGHEVIASAGLDEHGWVCESAVTGCTLPWANRLGLELHHFDERPIADRVLRPIRDQDGEDEMLRIVGLPNDQAVSA